MTNDFELLPNKRILFDLYSAKLLNGGGYGLNFELETGIVLIARFFIEILNFFFNVNGQIVSNGRKLSFYHIFAKKLKISSKLPLVIKSL